MPTADVLTIATPVPVHIAAPARHSWIATALIAGLPFVLMVVGIASGAHGHYAWFADEDGPAENLQFVFLVGAALGSGVVTRRRWRGGQRLLGLAYLGLAVALAFVAGEEISWGQRLFSIATPPTLDAVNIQHELNLHNTFLLTPLFYLAQFGLGMAIAVAALAPWHEVLPAEWDTVREALVPGP